MTQFTYRGHPVTDDRFTSVVLRIWTRPFWLAPITLLACVAGVSALVLATNPTDNAPGSFTGCAFKAATGLDCPGCGGTRALWFVLHGNLPDAARHHLIAVFAAPFLVYWYLAWVGRRLIPRMRGKPLGLRFTGRMAIWFLVAWGVFAVLRNVPLEPFSWFYV